MKWIEERDALIAQTKAFVESVTRRSADAAGSGARAVHRAPVVEPNSAISLTAAPANNPSAPTARPSEPTREAASKPAAPPASAPSALRYDACARRGSRE